MTDYALRGEVADAIREYCHSVSPAAVQMSHGTERIYYAGISLDGLTDAIAAAIEARGAAQAAIEPEARFLLDRLQEFDPGDFDAEREFYGHVAPAIARLRSALSSTPLYAPPSGLGDGNDR